MKKLIVLALVLLMATMASAELSIVGMPAGPVGFDETITLSIYSDAPIAYGSGDWSGWSLVTETSLANISGGVSMYPDEQGIAIFDPPIIGAVWLGPPPERDGIEGTICIIGSPIPAGTIFSNITFTAGRVMGDAHVTLAATQDYAELTTLDAGVIHIVPEPITMALLGLGGLFLRRRSK